MASAPGTIDLGELPRGELPEIEPSWPGWWRRHRQTAVWIRRWLPAAAAAVLLLLTATAAAAPARPWAVPHFTVPAGAQIYLGPEHLYAIEAPESGPESLVAYRLADGELLWEEPSPARANGGFTVQRGVPRFVSFRTIEAETGDEWFSYANSTTVFDPETGEQRWRHEGYPIFDSGEVIVFDRELDPPGSRSELAAVEAVTGRELWTLPPALRWGFDWNLPDGGRQVVSLADDGRLTSYDLQTGARLATATIALPEDLGEVFVVGSLLLLDSLEPPGLRAYDVTTFRHLWTTDLPDESWLVTECGQVLCVHGGLPRALDPATGELAWSADWPPPDSPAQREWFPSATWSPDHLVVAGRVVEAATGEPLLELTEWAPLPDSGALFGASEGFLTRHETSGDPAVRRTWFGQLHREPVRIETLGAVDGRQHDCQLVSGYLACREREDLHVWQIPG